ncbi:MAG: hypothetical protein LLH30_13165 [Candidatus Manganitrophus sp. SA1]|nr:hypothetical protein [Candidatus Manganitrophus morganii]
MEGYRLSGKRPKGEAGVRPLRERRARKWEIKGQGEERPIALRVHRTNSRRRGISAPAQVVEI